MSKDISDHESEGAMRYVGARQGAVESDYKILSDVTELGMVVSVRRHIKAGWKLQGGISFDSNRKVFLQAMVKG